jgi:hypothetical protein
MAQVMARQVASATVGAAAATSAPSSASTAVPICQGSNGYDGRLGVRISAVFVILVTSIIGIQRFPYRDSLSLSHHTTADMQQAAAFQSLRIETKEYGYQVGPSSSPNTLAPESSSQRLSYTYDAGSRPASRPKHD